MNALGGSLLHAWLALAGHLWQTSLILGLLVLISRALRGAPGRFVYLLWVVALAKLLLPLSLIGGWAGSLVLRMWPGLDLARRAVSGPTLIMLGQVVDPGGSLGRRGGPADPLLLGLLVALSVLWLGGIGLITYRFARSRGRSDGSPAPRTRTGDDGVETRLERALAGTGIPRDGIVLSADGTVPYVAGLHRPRIHLARDLVMTLGPAELGAVLVHEDAHRRRREPLRAALLGLIAALFFFYPLVHFVRRRILQAAELICDEEVGRRGIRPETYARALASTINLGLVPAPRRFAAGVYSGSFLQMRLERIRSRRRSDKMPRHYLTLGAAVLVVVAGSLLPVQLLTGCSRETQPALRGVKEGAGMPPAPADVGNLSSDGDSLVVDASQPANDDPSPDAFVQVEEMPVLITPPQPVYPEEAKAAGVEGVVTVRALVTREGRIEKAFATEGPPMLIDAAVTSVKKATFKPALQQKKPVAVWVQIPIRFALH